jgi:hypothetical protein
VGDGKKEHAHPQGNHGKKDLVQTHRKKADQQCGQQSHEHPRAEQQKEVLMPGLQQQGTSVRAQAEKGAMAEGEKSGIAEQQIEADRQQPHDQDFGKNHDPVDRQQQRGKQQNQQQQERTNELGTQRQAHAHTPFRNSPVGLTSRITAKSR